MFMSQSNSWFCFRVPSLLHVWKTIFPNGHIEDSYPRHSWECWQSFSLRDFNKPSKSLNALKVHMCTLSSIRKEIHISPKAAKCSCVLGHISDLARPTCRKQYSRRDALNTHIRDTHENVGKAFLCQSCNKVARVSVPSRCTWATFTYPRKAVTEHISWNSILYTKKTK